MRAGYRTSIRQVVAAIAAMAALSFAAGCGAAVVSAGGSGASSTTTTTGTTTGSSTGQVIGETPNWDNPTGGDPVPDLSTAQQEVGASIPEPQGLGTFTTIIVSPPAPTRVATFIYDTPNYGRVDVTEGPSQFTAASWSDYLSAAVAGNSDPNVSGSANTVTVQGQFAGLETVSADGSNGAVDWLNPTTGIEFVVRGPTLTPAQSLAVANALAG